MARDRGQVAALVTAVALAFGLTAWRTAPLLGSCTTAFPSAILVDALFVTWTLAWQTRALVSDPLHVGQAPIFHPTPDALFYGQLATGLLPFFAPAFLVSGNPVFALNFAYLASLTLTGVALHLVVRHWTGSWLAGAVACGVLFLSPFVPETADAPQWGAYAALPLLVLLAGRLRSWRRVLALGVVAAWQATTDLVYVAPTVFATLGCWALLRCVRASTRREGARLVAGMATALVLLLPLLEGFARVVRANPDLREQTTWRGLPADYFATAPPREAEALRHALATVRERRLDALRLTGPLIGLGVGAWLRQRYRGRRAAPAAAWIGSGLFVGVPIVMVALSTASYDPIVAHGVALDVPLFRVPGRFILTAMVALAMVGGLAAGAILGTRHTRGSVRALIPLATAIGLGFVLARPALSRLVLTPCPVLGSMLAVLRSGSGPLLELPMTRSPLPNGVAMYRAVFHRRPILNGYASYWPATWPGRIALAERLPDASALAALIRQTGVAEILIWLDALAPPTAARWGAAYENPPPGLRPKFRGENALLFEVVSPAGPVP